MDLYVSTPSILTDGIFVANGGQTGTSTPSQRTTAYAIAEAQAAQEVGTFLQPTTVTGTFAWPAFGRPLQLPQDRLHTVVSVTAIHEGGCDCADDSVEIGGCAWVLNQAAGLLELSECGNVVKWSCACSQGYGGMPKLVRVVYRAGLNVEASTDYRVLLALTTAADLALQQIIDPSGAEGGPGDPGVQSFGAAGYSETRTPLRPTAFGSSARANYAAGLLHPFRLKRGLALGY